MFVLRWCGTTFFLMMGKIDVEILDCCVKWKSSPRRQQLLLFPLKYSPTQSIMISLLIFNTWICSVFFPRANFLVQFQVRHLHPLEPLPNHTTEVKESSSSTTIPKFTDTNNQHQVFPYWSSSVILKYYSTFMWMNVSKLSNTFKIFRSVWIWCL